MICKIKFKNISHITTENLYMRRYLNNKPNTLFFFYGFQLKCMRVERKPIYVSVEYFYFNSLGK